MEIINLNTVSTSQFDKQNNSAFAFKPMSSRAALVLCLVPIVALVFGGQMFEYLYFRRFVKNAVVNAVHEYDEHHRRDARLCHASELALCSPPGECQRVECFKFRHVPTPQCQILPDVTLDGTPCDDNDPDTTVSACLSGICEGIATAAPTQQPTQSPTTAPTTQPTPSPTIDPIRVCDSGELALCTAKTCQSLSCYVVDGNSGSPTCVYAPDTAANNLPCNDGDAYTAQSVCWDGECQKDVSHECNATEVALYCNTTLADLSLDPLCYAPSCFVLPSGIARCNAVAINSTVTPFDIVTGASVSCSIADNSVARCWGSNTGGALGVGSFASVSTPIPNLVVFSYPTVNKIRQMCIGFQFVCALLTDGNITCWGTDSTGALGLGNATTALSAPHPTLFVNTSVATSSPASQITCGAGHVCSLHANGDLLCWGNSFFGQIGLNISGTLFAPTQRVNLSYPAQAAYVCAGSLHTCVLFVDGAVKCWGFGGRHGYTGGDRLIPSPNQTVTFTNGAVRKLSCGSVFTCALMANGAVECWGSSSNQELGVPNPPTGSSATPIIALPFSRPVRDIVSGADHTCVFYNDLPPAFSCWGINTFKQLGMNFTSSPMLQNQTTIFSFNDSRMLSVFSAQGSRHSCVRFSDGSARCFGDNGVGQLANGLVLGSNFGFLESSSFMISPQPICTRKNRACTALEAASTCTTPVNSCQKAACSVSSMDVTHPLCTYEPDASRNGLSCDDGDALTPNSTCYAGQCRPPTTFQPTKLPTFAPTPLPTPQPTAQPTLQPTRAPTPQPTVDAIRPCNATEALQCPAAVQCTYMRCQIVAEQVTEPSCYELPNTTLDGTACNDNDVYTSSSVCYQGECRNNVARDCTGLERSTYCNLTATGFSHDTECYRPTCIVLPSDSVHCSLEPIPYYTDEVEPMLDMSQYSTCLLYHSGAVRCWGSQFAYGSLGYNDCCAARYAPTAGETLVVPHEPHVVEIAAGILHGCARYSNGDTVCWGSDFNGALGYGFSFFGAFLASYVSGPISMSYPYPVKQISAGYETTCAVFTDGAGKCWGVNTDGSLGYGDGVQRNTPPVAAINMSSVFGLSRIEISSNFHSCGLLSDGALKCWGRNTQGQLGIGSFASQSSPPLTPINVTNVTQVCLGAEFTCSLHSDSSIRCWGRNLEGQLGYGDFTQRTSPSATAINVSSPFRVVQIACGDFHVCALLENGRAKCWGDNGFGQLGRTDSPTNAPHATETLNTSHPFPIKQIAAAGIQTCLRYSNGEIACFGYGGYGALGSGDASDRTISTAVVVQSATSRLCNETGSRNCTQSEYLYTCGDIAAAVQCRKTSCTVIDGAYPLCSDAVDVSLNGTACDDYNSLTPSSICVNGQCIGTPAPTRQPTPQPTTLPTSNPTRAPTFSPTPQPTRSPTFAPTPQPTVDALRMCNASELATCGAPLQCTQFDCRIVSEQVSEPLCTPMANASANGVACDDGDLNTGLSVCFNGACRADVARECTSLEVQTYCGSLTSASVCTQVGCVILPSGSAFCADHANYSSNGIACDYDGGYLNYDPRSKCYNGHCVPLQTTTCDPPVRDSPIFVAGAGSGTAALIQNTGKIVTWGSATATGMGVPFIIGSLPYVLPGSLGYVPLRNGSSDAPYFFVTDIVGFNLGFCAILNSSFVICWGNCGPCGHGLSGPYGNGGASYPYVFQIPTVNLHQENGTQILPKKLYSSPSASHLCAILQNDRPKCWGAAGSGQLGYGTFAAIGAGTLTPEVDSQTSYTIIPTTNGTVKQMATGAGHTCAITPPPVRLYCWGQNSVGQLGFGDTTQRSSAVTAVNVTTDGDVPLQVACASSSTCVLMENSRDVRCWGLGTSGQLGQNSTANLGTTNATIPALIPYIQGIVSSADYTAGVRVDFLCAGSNSYCAYLNNSNVKCWGSNFGFSTGTTTNVGDNAGNAVALATYSRIISVEESNRGIRVTQIACGDAHLCVVLSNNQLKCFGSATSGQIGIGTTASTGSSLNNTADQEWYPYTNFRPVETTADSACSCVCVQQNTSDVSLLEDFLIGTTGVECPAVPTPVGATYCPSGTFPDVRCVCEDLIHSTAPTRSPTVSPTRSPTVSPTQSPTVSPTVSPTRSATVSPTQSPVPAPP